MIKTISKAIRRVVSKITKNYYRKKVSKKYNGRPCSILSSNCIGGVICNRIGQPQNSPTFNLWIPQRDFIKFVRNLDYYLAQELRFLQDNDCDYPVALLDDVRINFRHYTSDSDALESWEKRKKRLIFDNLYIVMYEDEVTREDLLQLQDVPCKKKIVLTSKKDNLDLPYMKYIEKDKHNRENSSEFLDFDFLGRRTFEKQWDYVSWLND